MSQAQKDNQDAGFHLHAGGWLSLGREPTLREQLFVSISGIIGAGKTTLATALAKELDVPVYYEKVIDNEYLEDFYADMKKYSFQLQVYLLNIRFRQHQQIIWQGRGAVQDRSIYEDSIFAKILMTSGQMDARDYRTYMDLFSNMSNFMRKPNLIVHLDVTPEESMERIRMRARGCETGITLEYLRALYDGYNAFLSDIAKVIPVIKVRYSAFRTGEEMARVVVQEWRRLQSIAVVDFVERPSTPIPTKACATPPLASPEKAQ